MKKSLICLFILVFLTGCSSDIEAKTVSYNLDISDSYNEKIVISLSNDAYKIAKEYSPLKGEYVSLEYSLLNEKIYPINTSSDIYYDKKVKKKDNQVVVTLANNFSEADFMNEGYIYKCFENYELKGTNGYFEISLSGKYYCKNNFSKLVINVSNRNYVLESNGIENSDGYSWVIDDNNYNNVNIHYKFSRDYDSMVKEVKNKDITKKKIISIVKFILIIGAFVILCKTYNKYKSLGV